MSEQRDEQRAGTGNRARDGDSDDVQREPSRRARLSIIAIAVVFFGTLFCMCLVVFVIAVA